MPLLEQFERQPERSPLNLSKKSMPDEDIFLNISSKLITWLLMVDGLEKAGDVIFVMVTISED